MSALHCPKCRVPLDPHPVMPETAVDACPRCFGVFYERDELAVPLKLEILADSALGCPLCGRPMKVGQAGGGRLVLDQCQDCGGVWFDMGEIQTLRQITGVEQIAKTSRARGPAGPGPAPAPPGRPEPSGPGGPAPAPDGDRRSSRRRSGMGRPPEPVEMSAQENPDEDRAPSVFYDGVRFSHFQTSIPVTTQVLGEFPWLAAAGDKVRARDFIAPPYMLTNEVGEGESTWSLGVYVTPEEVWSAFGAPGSAPPAPLGNAPAQPNPWDMDLPALLTQCLLAVLAVGALSLAFNTFGGGGRAVFSQSFVFSAGDPERSRVTEVFEVEGRISNLMVDIDSNLDNHWAVVNMALINADSDEALDFGKELSYDHGYEDGESWSEGRPNGSVVIPAVPPGRYYLRVEPETDASPLSLRFTLRRDVFLARLPLTALLLLLSPLLWAWVRRESFENERWSESDHPRDPGFEEWEDR